MTLRPLLPVAWLVLLAAVLVVLVVVGYRRAAPGAGRAPVRTRWLVRGGAALALLVIAAGPSVPVVRELPARPATVDVLLVVDRTGSMAAEDWGPGAPRLDGVRADVRTLVQALPGARWSVLSWDSEAVRQLPFTTDASAVLSWAATARQEITAYSTGSRLDRPLDALTEVLADDAARTPGNRRVVILMSDGEQTSDGAVDSFAEVAALVDEGAVLGYGTEAGGRMRSYDGSADPDPDAPWITGDDGTPAVSRIDEAALRTVADELGVPYLPRTDADPAALEQLVAGLGDPAASEGRRQVTWSARSWPAALVLALAAGLELVWSVHEWPSRRRRQR